MRRSSKVLFAAFFFVTGLFMARLPVTLAAARNWLGTPATDSDVNWHAALEDVLEIIRERYVEPPNEAELLKGAIHGMTDALDDPYTEFIAPSDRAAFEKDLTGQFVGIGASVNIRDGWLTIAYPLEQSPAYRAGMRPGDQVRAIDGKSTEGLSVDQCIKLLMGEPGTKVTLTVAREAGAGAKKNEAAPKAEADKAPSTPDSKPDPKADTHTETVTIEINRAPIAARSVRGFRYDSLKEDWDYRIDPASDLAYIRVDQFTPGVADEFRNALAAAAGTGRCRGVIIDLRDNPGGLMDQAVEIVDLFLESGNIVSTKGRSGEGEKYDAEPGSVGTAPVVILVNQGSASASEIVAGAMADNQRATIIGTRSFGKGLVQRVQPLAHVPGAQLKITEQHYYLPGGRMIQRTDKSQAWGVDPSEGFYVPLSDEQQRRVWQVKRAMEIIRPPMLDAGGSRIAAPAPAKDRDLAELVAAPAQKWAAPEWIETELKDPQLAAGLKALQRRVGEGTWVATGQKLPDQAKAISSVELQKLARERDRMERFLNRLDERIAALEGGEAAALGHRNDDLWDDSIDLTGGKLEIRDRDGHVVASLDITGPDIERWLLDADVKGPPKKDTAEKDSEPKPEAPAAPSQK